MFYHPTINQVVNRFERGWLNAQHRFQLVQQGRVVQSWVKIIQGSARFEFKFESLKSISVLTLFVYKLMIESSRYNRENYPRKCFLTQERETRVKFNPGLSADRPSNIWAQQFCKASCMCLLPVLPKLKYTLFLLFLLQRNSNFSVGLDTKWPKGIWTCWTH